MFPIQTIGMQVYKGCIEALMESDASEAPDGPLFAGSASPNGIIEAWGNVFDPVLISVLLTSCKLKRQLSVNHVTTISTLVLSSCRSWNICYKDAKVLVPFSREPFIKWNLENYQKKLR